MYSHRLAVIARPVPFLLSPALHNLYKFCGLSAAFWAVGTLGGLSGAEAGCPVRTRSRYGFLKPIAATLLTPQKPARGGRTAELNAPAPAATGLNDDIPCGLTAGVRDRGDVAGESAASTANLNDTGAHPRQRTAPPIQLGTYSWGSKSMVLWTTGQPSSTGIPTGEQHRAAGRLSGTPQRYLRIDALSAVTKGYRMCS